MADLLGGLKSILADLYVRCWSVSRDSCCSAGLRLRCPSFRRRSPAAPGWARCLRAWCWSVTAPCVPVDRPSRSPRDLWRHNIHNYSSHAVQAAVFVICDVTTYTWSFTQHIRSYVRRYQGDTAHFIRWFVFRHFLFSSDFVFVRTIFVSREIKKS